MSSSRTDGRTALGFALGVAVLSACEASHEVDLELAGPGSVLTLDARELPPGSRVCPRELSTDAGLLADPLPETGARLLKLVEVVDVDELIVDSIRGREHLRIANLVGRDPHWPAEMNLWMAEVGQPAFEAWLRTPGARLFEYPPVPGARAGWLAELHETDPEGLRPARIFRQDAEGATRSLRNEAVDRGWAVASTHWTAVPELSAGLLLDVSRAEQGVTRLPAARTLLAEYLASAQAEFSRSDEEWTRIGNAELARVARELDWEPAAPVRVEALDDEQALERFEELMIAYGERGAHWSELERARASALGEAPGRSETPSFRLDFIDPADAARERVDTLAAWSPAGPTVFLLKKSASAGVVLEARLIHELLHQFQEERYDRNGLFPAPGIFGSLLEPHAEWHTTRILRARHPELRRYRGMDSFWHALLFERLVSETEVGADEALARFYDDTWSAYAWERVFSGEQPLQEYLFTHHGSTGFGGLDFRLGADWPGEPVIVVENTSSEVQRVHFHGVWLLQAPGDGQEAEEIRDAPFNAVLPPGGELQVVLGEDLSPRGREARRACGLYSPSPLMRPR